MESTKKTVIITGSTRGIGLAFVEYYIKAGWNVIGTARANSNTKQPNLQLAAKARGPATVVQISSFLRSTSSNANGITVFGEYYGYSTSKAALNMITWSLATNLRSSDILVVAIHPGYVDTDLS